MSKLTLTVDERVVSRAKRYAKRRGVSVSALVEGYLASLAESPDISLEDSPPILHRCQTPMKSSEALRYNAGCLAAQAITTLSLFNTQGTGYCQSDSDDLYDVEGFRRRNRRWTRY